MLVNVAPRVSLGTRHVSTLSAPFFRLLPGARAPSTPLRLRRGILAGLLPHGRTDIGKKCTCRRKSRDALTDITEEERSRCKKRNGPSPWRNTRGIKSFGIRVYAARQRCKASLPIFTFGCLSARGNIESRLKKEITAMERKSSVIYELFLPSSFFPLALFALGLIPRIALF